MATSTTVKMKIILFWSFDFFSNRKNNLRQGLRTPGPNLFSVNNCPHNCYITSDNNYFGIGNEHKFDAIIFDASYLNSIKDRTYFPQKRSIDQKYIFSCITESFTSPICPAIYDDFFDWTATYKKGSDIWFQRNKDILRENIFTACESLGKGVLPDLSHKKKAVVWCISNCTNREKQLSYTKSLKKELEKYGQTFDIYGCEESRKYNSTECDLMRDDYYFYFDFDPVPEEVKICPVAQKSVPIVYGTEYYARFMPLETYIDASKYKNEYLSRDIAYNVNNPQKYNDFFAYRNTSTLYWSPHARAFSCQVCMALYDESMMKVTKTYAKFRSWWYEGYELACAQV